ncbi:MAG: GNAT family N-acetyltransferase [Chloroflexi bacterium]|nr:GNAT family N-acetyltransferase [Chloroflexota bacterium]MCC6892101.1 GNAT family N-acetyltransferase [Anaerolineae bacterium]
MLFGERVTLRGITRDDLERQWEFNNDVEVELAGGGDPPYPQSLARLQAEFDQNAGSGGRDGTSFAIEADGIYIGQCALFNYNDISHTCELGITIGDKDYWAKGYGREAITLLLDYAFRLRNIRKVWLQVHGNNPRAISAYKACGFVEEGRLRAHVWSSGHYVDLVQMGVLRDEWQPK